MRWSPIVACAFGCSGGEAVDCAALDPDACGDEPSCLVIEGTPTSLASEDPTDPSAPACWTPAGEIEAVGCRPAEGGCPPEEVFAAPPDADTDPWWFPTGCYPSDWEKGDFLAECEE